MIYEVADSKQHYKWIWRGVFNFVGKISKIFRGMLDKDYVDYLTNRTF
jgi:hypothetical protein